MKLSVVTGLHNLPGELFTKILDQVDDESVIKLSMTCKELHSLALDVLFNRFKIPKDTASFYLQQPPAYLLRALRMALFVHRASSFIIMPNPDTERLLPDVLSLNRFISRMATMTCSTFIFGPSSLPLSNQDSSFDEERWTREIIRLFDIVLVKSCVHLKVSGDMIPTHPTSTGAQPTNASLPRAAPSRRLFGKMGDQLRNLPNSSKRTIVSLIRHLGSRRHHRILRHFHAHSPDLFQPHFLEWTKSTLQTSSHALTEVSFKTDSVPASTWHDLLSQVTLPLLSKFQVTRDRIIEQRTVDFDDMLKFLIRHPLIVNLDLSGLTSPTNSRHHWDLLPALQMLTSYPELIIWLLDYECPFFRSILFRCGKAREYPLKSLRSLNIVSEVYREPAAFNYDTFDNVLALLPRSTPSLTTLTFSFFSFPGVTQWLDKQISQGPLAALERITSLEVVSPRSWEGVLMDRIPLFLELFPGLQDFIYPAPVEETFLRDIAQACPRMRRVTVGDIQVDLNSLKEG